MLCAKSDTPDFKTRLYVGLPDPSLLASYDGFTPVAESELPRSGHLLFGSEAAFEAHFRWRR